MKALSEPLEQLNSFIQVKEYLQEGKGPVHISGTECSDRVFVMNGCAESADVRLVVTYDEERANRLYEDFRFYEKMFSYILQRTCCSSVQIYTETL